MKASIGILFSHLEDMVQQYVDIQGLNINHMDEQDEDGILLLETPSQLGVDASGDKPTFSVKVSTKISCTVARLR